MQLWNDYEGKTLAGTFPIETLLFTEGRNACFATHDRDGRPAVLRLTEALNDQEEMRARYGAIQSVGQRNLVSIEDFGDVEIEGTPLIYLVMESTQENLADILEERPLSVNEAGEVAISLADAIEALHAHGLVHGFVEPASVMAVDSVIKLRSDCVRPAPEGESGMRARATDVFGLADVLNRCLTQNPLLDASDALALPEPYATIVRNVVRGSWGMEQVAQELRRLARPARLSGVDCGTRELQEAAQPADVGAPAPADIFLLPSAPLTAPATAPQLPPPYGSAIEDESRGPFARRTGREPSAEAQSSHTTAWLAGGISLVLLLVLAWHFAGSHKARAGAGGPPVAPSKPAMALLTPAASRATPVAAAGYVLPAAVNAHATNAEVWRVVAYTYNVEAQAKAKARLIGERHADLRPEVYSRTGHAPFLVTLGGPLSRQQAANIRERARSRGLARDVYMQNYPR